MNFARQVLVTGLISLLGAIAQAGAPASAVSLNIAEQPMPDALNALAEQTGLHVIFPMPAVEGRISPKLEGRYTPQEALKILLSGTHLSYEFVNAKTIAIRMSAAASETSTARSEYTDVQLVQADQGTQNSENAAAAAAAPPVKDSSDELEQIVVTAQKREERLQDVPISISVLSGDNLDRSNIPSVTEALRQVPGVSIQDNWLAGGANVAIRGAAGPSVPIFSGSSPTAFYLDDAPFGLVRSSMGPNPNVYDLDRIEVLRGPQGTLYGASALNGVVRVLTKDANPSAFEVKARTSASGTEDGDESYRGDLAINVPIVEGKLAARAVVGYQNLGGWIDKPNRGERNVDDAQLRDTRLRIKAQPTEQLSVGVSAWLSRSDRGSHFGVDPDGQNVSRLAEPISTDYDTYSLKIGYELPWFSVASMTSYFDYANRWVSDLSPAAALPTRYQGDIEGTSFAQEVLFNSTHGGPWRWSAGAIYRDSDTDDHVIIASLAPLGRVFKSESYAVFGELTRVFLDGQLELTAGLRHFEDDAAQREYARLGVVLPPEQLIGRDDHFHATTPRFALTWHPSEQLMVYASHGEGFRSGNQQNPQFLALAPIPPAGPDRLKNYEVGAKGSLLDGRLDFETALYYIDWQDIQSTLGLLVNVGGTPVGFVGFVNGESASGMGVDFGVMTRPVERLELGVNFSWNDLTMDGDVLSFGDLLFAKGDRLDNSPKYTVAGSADYVFPLSRSGFEGRLAVSANYTSEVGQTALIGGVRQVGLSDPLLIARTSVSVRAPRHWTASLFVDNVSNERGAMSRSPIPGPLALVLARPRVIGVQLEYEFGRQ